MVDRTSNQGVQPRTLVAANNLENVIERAGGGIGGEGFQANANSQRLPEPLHKLTKQVSDFFSKMVKQPVVSRFNAYISKNAMQKISVEMPGLILPKSASKGVGSEATPSFLRTPFIDHKNTDLHPKAQGDKRAAALRDLNQTIDAETNRAIKSAQGAEAIKIMEESPARQLYMKMFGQDSAKLSPEEKESAGALVDRFVLNMESVDAFYRPENAGPREALETFLQHNGSFEFVDTADSSHFEYDSKTGVISISSSLLAEGDGDAFFDLIKTNLMLGSDGTLAVGKAGVLALDQMEMGLEALKAEMAAQKPILDLSRPAEPITSTFYDYVNSDQGRRPAQRIVVHDDYTKNPNYGILFDDLWARGVESELSPVQLQPQSEDEMIHTLMFGRNHMAPKPAEMAGILADPALKNAIMVFLSDGGTFDIESTGFSLDEARRDAVRFIPAEKTIVLTSEDRVIKAETLEPLLRDIFNLQ